MARRVVITGLGAVTPLGHNVPTAWDALINGKSAAAKIAAFDASPYPIQIACEVKGFDPKDHLDARDARRMDRCTQFTVVAAGEALAALDSPSIIPTATTWGSTGHCGRGHRHPAGAAEGARHQGRQPGKPLLPCYNDPRRPGRADRHQLGVNPQLMAICPAGPSGIVIAGKGVYPAGALGVVHPLLLQ